MTRIQTAHTIEAEAAESRAQAAEQRVIELEAELQRLRDQLPRQPPPDAGTSG